MTVNNKKPVKGTTDKKTQGGKAIRRPRFWQSKISGMNLRRHPRSSELAPCVLGMTGTLKVARVDEMGPRRVRLRGAIYDLYNSDSNPDNIRKNERYVDMILHRAGLVNSVLQARQLLLHGHVYLLHGNEFKVLTANVALNEGELVGITRELWNEVRSASITQWRGWKSSDESTKLVDGTAELPKRVIPPYLEVDYVNGTAVLVARPSEDSILSPLGISMV